MAEHHASLRYSWIGFSEQERLEIESDLTELQEQFGGAFSQEESEAVVSGFGGDVIRAASLYKNLTDGYVSFMTVEELIKAGKENV